MADSFSYADAFEDGAPAAPAPSLAPTAPAVSPSPSAGPAPQSFSYNDAFGAPAPSAGGLLSNSPDDGWVSGAAKGAASGAIKGVSGAIGTVDNTANFADLLHAGIESRFTDKSWSDTLADMKAQRLAQQAPDATPAPGFWGKVGSTLHNLAGATDPRNVLPSAEWLNSKAAPVVGQYDPTSSVGRVAQAGVEVAAGSVGPGVGSAVEGATARMLLRGAADMAVPNMAAGAASQAATEATGNPYAGLAAGLVAPGAADSLARAGRKLPGPVGDYFTDVNDARIGKKLYGLSSDPAAVRDTMAPSDLSSNSSSVAVPGFKPTTGQITGDLGLLQAENAMKVADNTSFNARAGQQNTAAQGALQSIAAGGDEMKPSAVLQQHLATIDDATRQAQDRITDGASQLAAQLGPGETADSLGTTMRAKIEAAKQQAQQHRSNLYAAVDPDGTLATTSAPIADAVDSIRKGIDPYAEPMSDAERRLYGLAANMPDQIPYRSLVAFDQNLNSALPDATGASRFRLGQLKAAVSATLDGTADGLAQREAQEVASGVRNPADTVATRLEQAMPIGAGAPASGSSVFTPSGRQIGVQYGVVDAGGLTVSHRPDMTPNPDFPANLQPRDRTRAASEAQVSDIASRLQPERLGPSASAAEGAPIVGPDGIVESGNGRVLAIQRAHAQGGPQSQAYRDYLASHGFDTSDMAAPVLVRQRMTDLSPEDRVRFAQEANASPVMAASATERAKTDAVRMSDTVLSQYQGGDVASAANRPFVRSFLSNVADKGEAGAFAAPDGSLSLDGTRRVQNALLHAGYGDSKLVQSLAETGDPDIAAFGGVMSDHAGAMAQLRRGIAAGDIHQHANIAAPVLEAGRVVQRARSTNTKLDDAVAQQDAFSPISEAAHSVLKAGYGPDLTGRLSQSRMGAYLSDALGEARQQSAGARLFGEPLTARQILEGAESRNAQSTGTTDSRADGGVYPRQSPGTSGQAGGGPGAGARGSGGAGPRGQSSVVDRTSPASRSDPAAGERLRAAKAAHIDLVSRFDEGPVSKAIEKNDFGRYAKEAAAVPAMAIRKGDEGYATAKAYLRDSNNAPEMVEALTDRALAPLRANLTAEGTVKPTFYAKWKQDFAPALRALDEADPGFASRYDNAAKATELMVKAGAMREQALEAFQKGAAAKLIGAEDASEVQARVGRILDDKAAGVTKMRELVGQLQGNEEALQGLRRAGAAYLSTKFSNAAKEAATGEHTLSTKLPKEVADKRAVLASLFSEPEVNRINAVAHVLDLKQRSVDALRNKGTSQSSRDLAGLIKKAGDKAAHGHGLTTVLALAADHVAERVMDHGLAGVMTLDALGAGGAASGLWALNRIRRSNAHADQAAIYDALMNPERFAHYTAKVSPDQAERRGASIAASIRRQLIMQPIVQRATAEQQGGGVQGFARGGVPQRRGLQPPVDRRLADKAADGLIRDLARIDANMKASAIAQTALSPQA